MYSVNVGLSNGKQNLVLSLSDYWCGGEKRPKKEQRCQISVDQITLSEHTDEDIKRLFGIYERSDIYIIIAWKCVSSSATTTKSKQVGMANHQLL